MDLGTFYREFQNPPQLASLSSQTSSQSMANDLVEIKGFFFYLFFLVTNISLCIVNSWYNLSLQDSLPEKLAIYEKNIDEFDAFVDMLH